MIDLGVVKPGATIRIPFSTFNTAGAAVTMTSFAAADVLVYKDGSTTERASTAGYTATTDFDTKTGKHLIVIDLADNTTADFWAAGSEYLVAIDSVTVDSQTVGTWIARFRIGYPNAVLDTTIATLASQTSFTLTAGPAEDDALNGMWAIIHDAASAVQSSAVQVLDYTGSTKTVTLAAGATFTAAAKDNISFLVPMPLQATTIGRTLDVTATGAAGVDWANVENPTTTLALTNTTISDTTDDAILAAIAGIGTQGGAAVNTDATADNASGGISGVTSGTTKVGTQTGTFANTSNVNSTYHQITHSGNAIDWVYQFLTGGGTSVIEARWTGYLDGSNDTITFYAWNHVGGAWESIGTQVGQAGTTNVVKTLILYSRHRGTSSAELGKVYIRVACTGQTSPILYTDQLYVSYAVTSRSVGYALGAVWVDTLSGVAGTEAFVNGVADNPVLTWADALTIASSVNLRKYQIGNGSTITLVGSTTNKVFDGHEWNLALGGQDISDSMFIDANVSGVSTGTSAEFETCSIGTATIGPAFFWECSLSSTLTLEAVGDYHFYNCHSAVAGTGTPTIDLGALGSQNLQFRRWSGGLTLSNIASGDVISVDAVSGGTITLNGADGNVQVRGMVNIVDNRTGSPTLGTTNNMDARFDSVDSALTTIDDFLDTEVAAIKAKTDNLPASPAATGDIPTVAAIADGVWDEVLSGHLTGGTTGAGLNAAGSAGDPWSTALPGAYSAGTAGYIVGTNLDAIVSSRLASASYTAPLDAAGTRSAVGLASANLDTQLAAIAAYIDTEVATIVTQTSAASIRSAIGMASANLDTQLTTLDDFLDTEIAAIKAKTDNLPAAPAATGDIPSATTIADAILSRNVSNVESSAPEHSLCTIILASLESSISGTTWTIKRTNGSTTHATKTVTVDAAADPITGVT